MEKDEARGWSRKRRLEGETRSRTRCFAYGCASRDTTPGISFHKMPIKPEIRAKWMNACHRQDRDLPPAGRVCVCSAHFLPTDYRDASKSPLLKPGCVPSRFDCFPVEHKFNIQYNFLPPDSTPEASSDLARDAIAKKKTCSMPGCSNANDAQKGIFLHRFPMDTGEWKMWMKCCRREGFVPGRDPRICSEHFNDLSYQDPSRKILKPGAVPMEYAQIEISGDAAANSESLKQTYRNLTEVRENLFYSTATPIDVDFSRSEYNKAAAKDLKLETFEGQQAFMELLISLKCPNITHSAGKLYDFGRAISLGANARTKCIHVLMSSAKTSFERHSVIAYEPVLKTWRYPNGTNAALTRTEDCPATKGFLCINPYHLVKPLEAVCVVRGCDNQTGQNLFPHLIFFPVPDINKESEQYHQWLLRCGYENEEMVFSTESRICSVHFPENSIVNGSFPPRLKPKAIPSLNIPSAPDETDDFVNSPEIYPSNSRDGMWSFLKNSYIGSQIAKEFPNWQQTFVCPEYVLFTRVTIADPSESIDNICVITVNLFVTPDLTAVMKVNNVLLPEVAFEHCLLKGKLLNNEVLRKLFALDFSMI